MISLADAGPTPGWPVAADLWMHSPPMPISGVFHRLGLLKIFTLEERNDFVRSKEANDPRQHQTPQRELSPEMRTATGLSQTTGITAVQTVVRSDVSSQPPKGARMTLIGTPRAVTQPMRTASYECEHFLQFLPGADLSWTSPHPFASSSAVRNRFLLSLGRSR
jgi:hypothetical protein